MARNMKASWQIILKRSKEEKKYAGENFMKLIISF
jgi:hypothetical protein